jgi:antirestriction protein ArdC
LGCNVDKLRSGPEFQAWLRQCRCFHRYSFRNRILIWAQDPEATMVAGYRAWQKLSRQVRRGERGLRILAPVDRKDDDGERVVYGFKLATVFDVAQTDGDELTAPPSWPETDSCPEGLLDDLMHRAWHEGISIRLVNDPAAEGHGAGTRGWYEHTGKEITLVSTYGEPELVATFLHELAHHYDHDRWDGRRAGELVAESAAYLAGGELGVGIAKEAEAYTANWATCGADVLALADRSLAAAEAILDLVRPQEVAA